MPVAAEERRACGGQGAAGRARRARALILPPAEKEQVAQVLEDDAEVMSDAGLEKQLAEQPPDIREEILRINDEARPLALQVALLVPLLVALLGLFLSFRMMRLPDPAPPTAGTSTAQ